MRYELFSKSAAFTKRAFPWAAIGKAGTAFGLAGLGGYGLYKGIKAIGKSIGDSMAEKYNPDLRDYKGRIEDNDMYKRFNEAEKKGMRLSATSQALRDRIEQNFRDKDAEKVKDLNDGKINKIDYNRWKRDAIKDLYKGVEDKFEYKADKDRYMAANPQFMTGMQVAGYGPYAPYGGMPLYGRAGGRRRYGRGGGYAGFANGFVQGNSYGAPIMGGSVMVPGMNYAPQMGFGNAGIGYGATTGYTPMY